MIDSPHRGPKVYCPLVGKGPRASPRIRRYLARYPSGTHKGPALLPSHIRQLPGFLLLQYSNHFFFLFFSIFFFRRKIIFSNRLS